MFKLDHNMKEFCICFILTLFFFNSIQAKQNLIFQFCFLFILLAFIYWNYKKKGLLWKIWKKFKDISLPKGAKISIFIVFVGNLITIGVGRSYYPFYDVGMFRWSSKFSDVEKTLYVPKYYYWENGKAKVLDLRKEGFFFLAEHFGWGYTQEFTFSTAYHNKGQKENFEYILKKLKSNMVDKLWVGIHSVDYSTKQVKFDPDICNAVFINENKKIHYGPIYIPEYQLRECLK